MITLGFKKLTVKNWLQPDKVSSLFGGILPGDGKFHPITGDEWVQEILKPKLIEKVPAEVQRLFEVARGTLVYGYFFYPLYAVGIERLFQVVDAAVTHKCKIMGAPSSEKTFEKKIKWLARKRIITRDEEEMLNTTRKLRNMASHLEDQTILPPGPTIGIFERITKQINSLFSDT